ncbi:hypothetical protein CRG98_045568 [Punica granatum]|uniref:Protein BIG GRAIN 1-like A n=1 Tax=Punica granatum TaxID=22663 RepID=A0A2I0HQP4_PUNGR|nr:hypothetical protein CRG98_045568 [Punica granatum]
MYRPERASRADRFLHDRQIPSFSSTLLDKIYRSIDEPEAELGAPKSGRQSKCSGRGSSRIIQDPEIDGILRACLAEEMAGRKVRGRERQVSAELDKKMKAGDDFFSSNSSSSDSSYGGFSSSDTESMHDLKPWVSSFVPPPIPRPKPVRTSVSSAQSEKSGKTEKKTEEKQRRTAPAMFDYCHRYPSMDEAQLQHDEGIIKSKSRALKIYANLKKVKQPISPGGRLSSFINSLFTSGNVKKPKSYDDSNMERKSKSVQASTCSSASSFSRSCLSKNSPGTREKLRDGAKRTVRFYPVSVIVDEDLKPCGHKCLYGQDETTLMSASVPCNRKARSLGRKVEKAEEEIRHNGVVEKARSVEAAARDFLGDYHRNQKRTRSSPRETYRTHGRKDAYDEDDDDAASCSSSDLFELDHLAVIGSDSRYCEELPVYETTWVGRNLAIANGLVV